MYMLVLQDWLQQVDITAPPAVTQPQHYTLRATRAAKSKAGTQQQPSEFDLKGGLPYTHAMLRALLLPQATKQQALCSYTRQCATSSHP
jgi:hypothetical protein